MSDVFKIAERGSTPSTELFGGLTTFLTMAYIVAVNPIILVDAGVPFAAALTATCFGAAIMTILMGLIANRPLALASGMGINSIVAYSICIGQGADWRVAMAVVFLEGVAILVLVVCGLREAIMRAIPVDLRRAIGIGIGLFIAFIGLKGGGIISANEATLISMGSIKNPVVIVALVSLASAACSTPPRPPAGCSSPSSSPCWWASRWVSRSCPPPGTLALTSRPLRRPSSRYPTAAASPSPRCLPSPCCSCLSSAC